MDDATKSAMSRRCSVCKTYKPKSEFGKSGKYLKSKCRPCEAEYSLQHYHKTKLRARNASGPAIDITTPKQCTICKETKTLGDFYTKGVVGKFCNHCKKCNIAITNKWRIRNKEKVMEKMWERSLKKKYGVDRDYYNELLILQNGVCAICHKRPKRNKYLCVDHCHKTGRVRGLLCEFCNLGLGLFDDDRKTLEEAIRYINNSTE